MMQSFKVLIEEYSEGYILTSADVPGLLLAHKNLETMLSQVPYVAQYLFKANLKLDVEIEEVKLTSDEFIPLRSEREFLVKPK